MSERIESSMAGEHGVSGLYTREGGWCSLTYEKTKKYSQSYLRKINSANVLHGMKTFLSFITLLKMYLILILTYLTSTQLSLCRKTIIYLLSFF